MIETTIAVIGGIKLGVDFLAGLGKGIANIFGADDERNQQINALKYQNALLESERTESQRRFEVSQREGNTSIAQATVERDTMASFNAQAGVLGNKEAYEGATVNLRTVWGVPDSYTGADLAATMVASGVAGVTAEQILALEGKTFAEMTEKEKNAVSHRGRAMKKFAEILSDVSKIDKQPVTEGRNISMFLAPLN